MYYKNKYSDEDFMYAYPFSINGNGVDVKSTYKFNSGQQINLEFNINSNFKDSPITITIYDGNYQPLFESTDNYVDENNKVYMHISEIQSQTYLVPGIYYCGLYTTDLLYTLQAPNQCIIRIV